MSELDYLFLRYVLLTMKNTIPQNTVRLFLALIAIAIAFISLYYTDQLVKKLGEREQKLIDLYAKGLQSIAQSEDAGNLSFLFQEIIEANTSVPVILADSKRNPISQKNIILPNRLTKSEETAFLKNLMNEMATSYSPIEIEYIPGFKNYIYYKNSALINQLRYYPYIQLTVIFIFVMLGYLVFNNARKVEQNRVWVGMSKETAHQLATPLSSLMAWIEIFKSDPHFSQPEAVVELEKDINRLETITARFSNIGSVPVLKPENAMEVVQSSVAYLQLRVSTKVKFDFIAGVEIEPLKIAANRALFDWALENIVKNGVDAMGGIGSITISMTKLEENQLAIDITDSGKGMPKNQLKKVFEPGFTTKQRGWGLGLTLTKRIIEQYHGGKVFVKNSELGKGTCFRVMLTIC